MAEPAGRGSWARGAALLTQTPAKHNEQLVRDHPALVQRVAQRLSIKPGNLSRIRGGG